MTEPTDAEIESAWTEATGSSILPYPDDMLAFARAVLAKWGQPSGAGEPVATVIKKGADRQWMSERLGHLHDGIHSLYLAPPAQAADYDHGPQSENVQEAARHVGKWLNERPNHPLDLRDVAMLCAHAKAADSVLEDAALPMQPICIASDGVIRFKQNRMVNDVYEFSQLRGFGLNEMARRDYTQEERMQFAQLIGYSVSGYGGLSYASPESVEKADAIADSLIAARKQGANHD